MKHANEEVGLAFGDFMPSLENTSHLGLGLRQDGSYEIHQIVDTIMVPYVGDTTMLSFVQDIAALVPF